MTIKKLIKAKSSKTIIPSTIRRFNITSNKAVVVKRSVPIIPYFNIMKGRISALNLAANKKGLK